MDAHRTILDAMHDARGLLTYHLQSKHGRDPKETIEDLCEILQSVIVNEAVNALRRQRSEKAKRTRPHRH